MFAYTSPSAGECFLLFDWLISTDLRDSAKALPPTGRPPGYKFPWQAGSGWAVSPQAWAELKCRKYL